MEALYTRVKVKRNVVTVAIVKKYFDLTMAK